jgi:hypothetical protein
MTNEPGDCAFLLMLAIHGGSEIGVDGTDLYLDVGDAGRMPVPPETLDALEDRWWVTIGDDGTALTEQGLFALKKWMRKRIKARGRGVSVRFDSVYIRGR